MNRTDFTPGPTSGDGAGRLRELTQAAVAAAMEQQRDGDGAVIEWLRQACVIARGNGFPAEQLIILIKESWRHSPVTTDLERHEVEERLADVISACVKEYYDDGASH